MPDPDWLAHIAVAWILCRLLRIKFEQFDSKNTAIVMGGSLIPDIVKITYLFAFLGIDAGNFVAPFHTPMGALLSAALVSLLFEKGNRIFLLLVLGAASHFALDFLLMHVSGGIPLFFPFSWNEYLLNLIQTDDYWITAAALLLAGLTYLVTSRRKATFQR